MKQNLPGYICPKCGATIGYLGRFLVFIGVFDCNQHHATELDKKILESYKNG